MSAKIGSPKTYCLKAVLLFFLTFTLGSLDVQAVAADDGKSAKQIPSLDETVRIVLKHNLKTNGNSKNKPGADIVTAAKQYYYELQFKKEQLKVADDVKGYFEKAVTKAEEKFEEGDTAVSQTSLTKLKLGLSSTENDIIKLNSEMHIAKLSLGEIMGWELSFDSDITDAKIAPLEFKFNKFEEYLNSLGSLADEMGKKTGKISTARKSDDSSYLHKAFIKVMENRDKMNLAEKQKKMTRALLVTESANYDFGVGNSEDLFQALIIYTRVLSGYYESIYNYNLAVLDLDQIKARILAQEQL